jgi:hypothetical protein
MTRIVWKIRVHLTELVHLEWAIQSLDNSLYEYKRREVRPCLFIVSSESPLLLPCVCADLEPVNAKDAQPRNLVYR